MLYINMLLEHFCVDSFYRLLTYQMLCFNQIVSSETRVFSDMISNKWVGIRFMFVYFCLVKCHKTYGMCHALRIQIWLFTTTLFWNIPLPSNIVLTYIQNKCRNTCISSCKFSAIVIILYSQMKYVNISVETPVLSFIKIHVVVFGLLPLNWLGDMKILVRGLLQISP